MWNHHWKLFPVGLHSQPSLFQSLTASGHMLATCCWTVALRHRPCVHGSIFVLAKHVFVVITSCHLSALVQYLQGSLRRHMEHTTGAGWAGWGEIYGYPRPHLVTTRSQGIRILQYIHWEALFNNVQPIIELLRRRECTCSTLLFNAKKNSQMAIPMCPPSGNGIEVPLLHNFTNTWCGTPFKFLPLCYV